MRVDRTEPVATIATEVPAARAVFERLGIDYACGGARSLVDAAYEEGLDPETVLASMRRLRSPGKTISWSERPLADLVDHLTNEHNRLVREELATISFGMFELCAAPATPSRDLESLRAALVRLSEIVLPHMHEEEDKLFGPIRTEESPGRKPAGEELRARIRQTVSEHGTIAAQLRTIRNLRLSIEGSNEVQPVCATVLDAIARLEARLHESMFLENCVLLPRAVALREQMPAA